MTLLKKMSAPKIIALSFATVILCGTLLLMLPISSKDNQSVSFLTALFTATSSTCVTGLVVVDTYTQWSIFGQIILLLLIQIGGLGFITIICLIFVALNKQMGLRTRGLLQESINAMSIGSVDQLIKRIIRGTMLFEGIGAILLSIRFIPQFGWAQGLFYSVFHSVSAFCNAGFDLMGVQQVYNSFCNYATDPLVILTLSALIIIGGIGFFVWDDLSQNRLNFKKYKLHTKLTLIMTAFLLIFGTISFYLFERNNLLADAGFFDSFLMSFFSAVTPRTAGFNSIDTASLSSSSKLLTMFLMFVGGSSGSTAGGIKTTTLAVIVILLINQMIGKDSSSVFNRSLEDNIIKKAASVISVYFFLAFAVMLIILAIQPNLAMSDILFEVFSAIGTAGMSTGVTRELGTIARVLIILLMFSGRLGSYSFALLFIKKKQNVALQQIKEKVLIG